MATDPYVKLSSRESGLVVRYSSKKLHVPDPLAVPRDVQDAVGMPAMIDKVPCIYCSKQLSDTLSIVACGHVVHASCLPWLLKRYSTCSVCKLPTKNLGVGTFFARR
jgi:hypothetical protein